MATILVTGATGTVGSEVVKQLSSKADPNILVKAAVRSTSESINIKRRNVELVEADYNKQQSLDIDLSGIDSLFLLTPTHPKLVEFTSNLEPIPKIDRNIALRCYLCTCDLLLQENETSITY